MTLAQDHLHLKIEFVLSVTTGPFSGKFLMQGYRNKEMEIDQHNAGHMTKIAAMPISGKNTLKIFFPGTTGLILMKLCMKLQRPKTFIFCSIMTQC